MKQNVRRAENSKSWPQQIHVWSFLFTKIILLSFGFKFTIQPALKKHFCIRFSSDNSHWFPIHKEI